MKIPLGMEVGLSGGDIVLDGIQLRLRKRGTGPLPILGPCLLWSNGWMHYDAIWYVGKPRSRQHCVKWGSSSP